MVRESMTHYERLKRKRLADLIADEGLVEKDVVISALHELQQTGRLLSSILLDAEAIDQYDLARLIVEQYQVPFVDLENYSAHKDLIREFPAEVLHRARVVPLDRFGTSVCFACQEVPSPDSYKRLRETVGGVFVYAAYARDIVLLLAEHHPWEEPEADPVHAAGTGGSGAAKDMGEDKSWHSLFDSADESVMSDVGDEE